MSDMLPVGSYKFLSEYQLKLLENNMTHWDPNGDIGRKKIAPKKCWRKYQTNFFVFYFFQALLWKLTFLFLKVFKIIVMIFQFVK